MAWKDADYIVNHAENLARLALNLEKEIIAWRPVDPSPNPQPESPEFLEFKRRTAIIWANAVEAGVTIFELCGRGAFNDFPRAKNLVCQIRSKCKNALEEFRIPWPSGDYYSLSGHPVGKTLDAYFVKIFEGLCQIWIKSDDDRRTVGGYCDRLKPVARMHVKVMKELSDSLKSRYTKAP